MVKYANVTTLSVNLSDAVLSLSNGSERCGWKKGNILRNQMGIWLI